ncbi:hypothetical protein ACQ4PT_049242 [Festuca glaucescens]
MDRQLAPTQSELKCILFDEKAEPKALSLSLLKEITNGFSKDREIGSGGFAVVYKGMLNDGSAIAVKRISHTHMYEEEFKRELECLIRVKHKNVVRFIGYCVDSQGKVESYDGKFVIADLLQKLLCFEYLPYGTLEKYIMVLHLDLKPSNILLDGNMLPKITDFGLSRLFDESQSRAITKNIGGTIGYLAPEFGNHEITYQLDVYSLGVIIIEILTGKKGYKDVDSYNPQYNFKGVC